MKKKEESVTIFSSPDAIDNIIKLRLSTFSRKGAPCKNSAWTDDELELRRAVVIEYISQGLSKENTAQQIAARWGVTIGCARRYVKDAIDNFCATYADESISEHRKIWEKQVLKLLQDAVEDRSKDAQAKALDMLGKAYGLYSQKTDVNLSGDTTIHFDFNK